MSNSRILIVSPDRKHLGEIERCLQRAATGRQVTAIEGSLQRLGPLTGEMAAGILVVDCAADDIDALAPLDQFGRQYPDMAIVVLASQPSTDMLVHAMRLGVREVLQSPVNPVALEAAIDRIDARAGLSVARKGQVLAFVPCKGGSGATFLAANLAHALAAAGQKVALIDFDLQFGDALGALTEQKPVCDLAGVVRDIDRLDAALLAGSMVGAAPGLAVLAAPEDPAHGLEVKPEHVDAVIRAARSQHDYVVLDLGRTLDAPTVRALDHADTIYAVLQPALPSVRAARRLLDIFRSLGYAQHKVQAVLNRHEKDAGFELKDLEAALSAKVRRTVPNHYEAAAAALDQGVPVAQAAHGSPIARALQDWSEQLLGKTAPDGGNRITRAFTHTLGQAFKQALRRTQATSV